MIFHMAFDEQVLDSRLLDKILSAPLDNVTQRGCERRLRERRLSNFCIADKLDQHKSRT